jgi:hypothetical protein
MNLGLKMVTTVFGIIILWAALGMAGTPSLQLKETNHDFGEAEEGAVVSHDFELRNTGSAPLEIIEVRPG